MSDIGIISFNSLSLSTSSILIFLHFSIFSRYFFASSLFFVLGFMLEQMINCMLSNSLLSFKKASTTFAPPFLKNSPTKSKFIVFSLYSINESGMGLTQGYTTSVFFSMMSSSMPPYSNKDLLPCSLLNKSFLKFSRSSMPFENNILMNLGVGMPNKLNAPADEKCAGVYIKGWDVITGNSGASMISCIGDFT